MTTDNREAQKKTAAYFLWQKRGSPLWDDQADWFGAEREMVGEAKTAKKTSHLRETLGRLSKIWSD